MEGFIAPRGLIAELITPLRGNGTIDFQGLERLLSRVMPSVEAVFLASPYMGEGKNLGPDQRSDLAERAKSVLRGRIPILVWVTQDTEEKTTDTILTLRKGFEKGGMTGQIFWVDTPLYYHSNRGLPSYYRNLSSIADGPLILHNDPALIHALGKPLKRNNLRTGVLKELVLLKGIVGLIFLGSLDRANNYDRACRGLAHFRIYDGDETQFLDHPSMSGVVSIGANLAPRAWHRITQSSLRLMGAQEEYPDHLQQVWELGQYLRDLKEIYQPSPVAIIKEVLSEMGVIETPICTFSSGDVEEQKGRLKELMARYGDYSEGRL